MKVYGKQIKEARKRKKLSQAALAQGICTQATISNVESKNCCDSLIIFSAICARLDLQVDDCIELSSEKRLHQLLDQVEKKCSLNLYQEGYKLLHNYQLDGTESDKILFAKYHYYKGITALLGPENMEDALFHLHLVGDYDKKVGLYFILSLNAFGIYYVLSEELNHAKIYYDRIIGLLDSYTGDFFPSAYRVFFNASKFYSLVEDYPKSVLLAEQGIQLNKDQNTIFYLDFLYYELAFNKMMLKQSAIKEYKIAYYLTEHLGNEHLNQVILEDEKRYQLNLHLD